MEGDHQLKLIIERGPREGETQEFQPGKAVKIGRLVKGNTLAIKDAGISSHHLSIVFISGEWILSDLDSSNGTIVNGNFISADKPVTLVDGDTIKIGELSSIKVSIGVGNDYPGLRRNPSRRTVKNRDQWGLRQLGAAVEVNWQLVFEKEEAPAHIVEKKKTQRGRGAKKNRVGNNAVDGNSSLNDSHFEEENNKVQSKNNNVGGSDPRIEDDETHGNEPMLQENADGFEKEVGKEEEELIWRKCLLESSLIICRYL